MRHTRGQLRSDAYGALIRHPVIRARFKMSSQLPLFPDTIWSGIKKHFPEQEINSWLNEATDYVVRRTKCLYGEADTPVVAQSLWVYLWHDNDTPHNPVCFEPIALYWTDEDVTDKLLKPKRQFQIDAENEGWENTDGTTYPKNYVLVRQQRGSGSGQSFKLYPKPHKTGSIELKCLRLPTPMDVDSDICALEESHYEAIIRKIIVRATGEIKEHTFLEQQLSQMAQEASDRDQDEVVSVKFGTSTVSEAEEF